MPRSPTEERTIELGDDQDELRVGRNPRLEIELPFPSVSLLHAHLFRGDLPGTWWIEDLGSTNGTWLDEQRLMPRQPSPVRAGQRLRIATVDIVIEGWFALSGRAESTATLARRLISDLFGGPGGDVPSLTVDQGTTVDPPAPLRLAVRDRRYTVGRGEACDLVLPAGHVSREHLVFVRRWDGVVMSDLGSTNGVLVNGQVVSRETKLRDGDRVEVGPLALEFTDPEDRYLRRLDVLAKESAAAEASPAGQSAPGASPPADSAPLPSLSPSLWPSVSAEASPKVPSEQPPPLYVSSLSPPSDSHQASAAPRVLARGRSGRMNLALVLVAAVLLIALAGLVAVLWGLV